MSGPDAGATDLRPRPAPVPDLPSPDAPAVDEADAPAAGTSPRAAPRRRAGLRRRAADLASGLRFVGRALGSRYTPLLAQVVVTRRCNLACGYCSEFDDHSPPVPLAELLAAVDHLASLGTASLTLTGGEPLLHPELDQVVRHARAHGMIVTMITNGFKLTRAWVERLNDAGLQGMQISIDNLRPDAVSMKSLRSVEGKLA
ncbi:MAG: radical SAM protein, partial [Janthinobacterium lividum]